MSAAISRKERCDGKGCCGNPLKGTGHAVVGMLCYTGWDPITRTRGDGENARTPSKSINFCLTVSRVRWAGPAHRPSSCSRVPSRLGSHMGRVVLGASFTGSLATGPTQQPHSNIAYAEGQTQQPHSNIALHAVGPTQQPLFTARGGRSGVGDNAKTPIETSHVLRWG